MKKSSILGSILASLIIPGAIGLVLLLIAHHRKTTVSDQTITATVTNVVQRPNQSEDGYYGIQVEDSSGKLYTIDATGYLNSALSPASRGEACVSPPSVEIDDKLKFNLPKSSDQPDTFEICYKQNLTGYYIRLQ